MKILLDSAILIDHLRGIPEAHDWLEKQRQGDCCISVITRAEVLSGGPEEESGKAYALCELFPCMDITQSIADRAAELRRTHRWKLPDALQASVAIEHKVKLVTRNTKDFSPQTHSFVIIPYQIKPRTAK